MNASDRAGLAPADATALAAVSAWLEAFEQAMRQRSPADIAALFASEGYWRDLVAFTWRLQTFSGRDAIRTMLAERLAATDARDFRIAPGRSAPHPAVRAGVPVTEALIAFDTAAGTAEGVLRLVADPAGPGGVRAWIFVSALQQLHRPGQRGVVAAPAEPDYSRDFGGENWLDKRNRALAYADRDPAVVVIGAGQAGLSIAARLGRLGVDTLIVDRQQRVGDNWRKRYHALTLHNEVHVNHLPYMPFPPGWPTFIPKDKLANWFEAYVEAMELNCWMGTELVSGAYDAAAGCWDLNLRRADGSQRRMRPRHLVFATGVSSIPVMPQLPGLSDFSGTVLHSGAYTEGSAWRGKRALVLGTGNSGHDVAQDLQASGAAVTMIQRHSTHVVSIREAQRVYALYNEGMPTDDCDLLATAMPYPVLRRSYQLATEIAGKADKPLLDALAARGFALNDGEDHTGFQMMYLRRGGGYYFNVGCSDLIIGGRIDLLAYDRIERFVARGALLKDGRTVPADLLVMATGYKNQQDVVRAMLGDAIADRVGPVWGFDDGGELRNMWQPGAQPGLWFTAGSLAQCRIYSKYLALQIQAREAGLVP